MKILSQHINESQANSGFSKQAAVFDDQYGSDQIILYKRQRVRHKILRHLKPGSNVLELNCGTGEDAVFLAAAGHHIHATDLSSQMLAQLEKKVRRQTYPGRLTWEQCSFTQLDALKNKGPFDCVFSNFGGLNCTGQLDVVLQSLDSLVKPGGTVILVIISKFCLWELLLVFRGKFRTAFRRFSSGGRKANVEGIAFNCWYYSPSFVKAHLEERFNCVSSEGLCTIVPPSYLKDFAINFPRLFSWLKTWEDKLCTSSPWRMMGDYFVITFQKRV